jgi:hypothetical protein
MDVFTPKTGQFIRLEPDALASLTDDQLRAYSDLADAVDQLDAANAEMIAARAFNQAAVAQLDYAKANQPKPPTHVELVRQMQAAWRAEH